MQINQGGMMFTMTPREALEIQAHQIEHYKHLRADLAEHMAGITHITGLDLDTPLPVWRINELIPRGADIEYACGIADQGGN